MTVPGENRGSGGGPSHPRRSALRRLAVNAVLPVVLFPILRAHTSSDVAALALLGAIPVGGTLWFLFRQRRLDPLAAISATSFGFALLVTLVWPENGLLLKLHEAVLTSAIGFAFLAAALFGIPLHVVALRHVHAEAPDARDKRSVTHDRRAITISVIFGMTFLVHAAVHVILAVILPTEGFLLTSRVVGWAILGAGLAILILYQRRGGEVT